PPPTSTLFPYTTLFRSSGMPVTLTQRLHERYWPTRPEIPVLAQAIAPVRPDLFGGNAVARVGSIAMADSVANFEAAMPQAAPARSEEHTSELQSRENLV